MELTPDGSDKGYGTSTSNGSTPSVSVIHTIRLLMQGKEVGSIIGKRGDHIKQIRERSGAKINISDGSCPERIVTIIGSAATINRSFSMICRKFEEDLQALPNSVPKPPITMRMIVPATQCGSLIGKGGSKIKEIRERTGASIQVASEMLPQSTERAVTISGTCEAISDCMQEICQILQEAPPKGATLPYRPKPSYNPLLIASSAAAAAAAQQQAQQSIASLLQQQQLQQLQQVAQAQNATAAMYGQAAGVYPATTGAELARLQPYLAVSRFAPTTDLTSTFLTQNGLMSLPPQFACQFPGAVSMIGGADLLQKDQQALLWQAASGDDKQQQQQHASQSGAGQSAANAAAVAAAQQQHLELVQNLGQQYVLNNGLLAGRTMGVGGTPLKSDNTTVTQSGGGTTSSLLQSSSRRFSPY
ncbi:CRE-PES-4 protein [Aphelenchoides avenae]|nr:CRE-PES-4 protein [Aphelenchus avenae]